MRATWTPGTAGDPRNRSHWKAALQQPSPPPRPFHLQPDLATASFLLTEFPETILEELEVFGTEKHFEIKEVNYPNLGRT